MDQYDDFWAPWLTARGYAGSWKCRTQLTANKKDGCGLFFKSDRFELLAQRHIEFNDIAFGRPVGGATAAAVDAASARETPDDPESLDDARRALVRRLRRDPRVAPREIPVGRFARVGRIRALVLGPRARGRQIGAGASTAGGGGGFPSDGTPRGDDGHPRDPRRGL